MDALFHRVFVRAAGPVFFNVGFFRITFPAHGIFTQEAPSALRATRMRDVFYLSKARLA